MNHLLLYNKDHPFLASIKERRLLSKPGSNRQTYHLVLDLKGSNLKFEVGDSIGVLPWHDEELLEKTIRSMDIQKEETIFLKDSETPFSFINFLRRKANITEVSGKLFRAVALQQTNKEKHLFLDNLLKEENRDLFKKYLEEVAVWDFLEFNSEVRFSAQDYVDLLMPLLPRFYSIASAQKHRADEVHLTIASLQYRSNGHIRKGVCTHFLSDLVPLNEPIVPVFIQSSHSFRLPEDPHGTSLIMIGPGTGIAPFRAFLQERILHHHSTGKHWLFFGEQHRALDFYYEEEWEDFSSRGHLEIDVAFSRDQEDKIYVQHLMLKRGAEIYRWLEEGAHLYVCGDAKKMAKDVEQTLLTIIQTFGEKDLTEARHYIKKMRQEKRYLRDVY